MDNIRVEAPLTKAAARSLRAGDSVLISGTIYTARDAAHKRMVESGEIPFDIQNAVIYYTGPAPAREGRVIGPCGPTTSGRMDAYAPVLIAKGMTAMIGKGERNAEVINAMKEHTAVYFGAIGGAGALISKCVKSAEVIAYDDLGTEAVMRLEVVDFPAVVLIDSYGNSI
ncbi:MAG: Fumarate hydratase class I, aerobic [Firmicutes bacterium ADurb.Bin193]|nr:MAG: Fumarate hydratase class I, aerobic [Firmicutes bacterium ADurb.Bin193]